MKINNITIKSTTIPPEVPKPSSPSPPSEAILPPADAPPIPEAIRDTSLEDIFAKMFQSSVSGTGEEELLRIASTYSRQITAPQIRCLLYLEYRAFTSKSATTPKILRSFVDRWLELKQYNNSDAFVMKALEFISLRKFLNENSLKVNIDK